MRSFFASFHHVYDRYEICSVHLRKHLKSLYDPLSIIKLTRTITRGQTRRAFLPILKSIITIERIIFITLRCLFFRDLIIISVENHFIHFGHRWRSAVKLGWQGRSKLARPLN